MIHYNFETSDKSDLEANGNLLTLKVTIKPWEFVQLLSTGTIQEDIQPGEVRNVIKVYVIDWLSNTVVHYLK